MNDEEKKPEPSAEERLTRLGRVGSAQIRSGSHAPSRFIRIMRTVLPLVALAIIAVVFAWTSKNDDFTAPARQQEEQEQTIGKNELVNPRFESVDQKQQPFTITAERAVQGTDDEGMLILEKPIGDILLNDGAWLAIKANQGAYKEETQKLLLNGNVRLFHDTGYSMETEKLYVDLKNSTAMSDVDVYIQGPAGTLNAKGLQGDNQSGNLVFTGPALMVLYDAGNMNLERLR